MHDVLPIDHQQKIMKQTWSRTNNELGNCPQLLVIADDKGLVLDYLVVPNMGNK